MSEPRRKVGRPRHTDPNYREKYQERYRNTLLPCSCGLEIKKGSMYHHRRTKLHQWLDKAKAQKVGEN